MCLVGTGKGAVEHEIEPAATIAVDSLAEAPAADRNPAAVYLRSLGSDTSRANMRSALRSVVRIATGGSSDDVERFP